MRDNDTVILESLYNNLVVEGVEDQKKQAENLLIANRVGRDIWKYKNKPENQQAIEQARQEVQPLFQQLLGIAEPYQQDPFGKNMGHLPELTKFYLQKPDLNLIQNEYKKYMSIGSIKNKNLIKKETEFIKWAEAIHSAEALENLKKQPKEEPAQKDDKDVDRKDQNTVYEDENVIVYLANNVNDPKESLKNCQKYGKGSSLCISTGNARSYYHRYRWEDKLTTYFVWLKDKRKYVLIDANEEGGFQYNNISDNTDRQASKEQIIEKYPQLQQPFAQGVFKSVPIQGKELEFYEKFYDIDNIFDLKSLEDRVTYATINDISYDDWKSYFLLKPIPMEEIKLVLQTYIESAELDIPHWILEKFPALQKRYWNKKENNLRIELENWSVDDVEDFTNDEWSILFKDKDLMGLAIEKIPRIKKEKEETEKFLNRIKSKTDKDGVYPSDSTGLTDIHATMVSIFPLDLSFLKKVRASIKIPHAIDVNLENLEYCETIEARSSKNINLKNLKHVLGDIYLGSSGILDLPNLVTCSGRIQADYAAIVNMPKLIRAKDLKFYSAKKIELPNLIEVDSGSTGSGREYYGTVTTTAKEIILPKLKKCKQISSSDEVTKLEIPSLKEIEFIDIGNLKVNSISLPCQKMKELDLGECQRVNLPNLEEIRILRAVWGKEVNIPKLKHCRDLYVDSMEDVNLPELEIIEYSASFAKAKRIVLKNLKEIGSLHTENAEEIKLTKLEKIRDHTSFSIPKVKRLDLINLEYLGVNTLVLNAENLKILNLPKLSYIVATKDEIITWIYQIIKQNLDRLTITWSLWDQIERRFKDLHKAINDNVKDNQLELNTIFNGKISKYRPSLTKESFKDYFNISK